VGSTTAVERTVEEDDRVLLDRARSGGDGADEAFLALYDRYKDEVYTFLVRFLRDEALAEDTLQDAFFRVFRSLERCDLDRPFRPWLHQIARNAAIDAIRVRRKEERLAAADATRRPKEGGPGVVDEVERREASARARAALESLPDETRALLVQKHELGMKLEEIAESWSCSERTIRTRLQAAAARLFEAFSTRGGSR
jgi:RNA polymerase sigma-70 factor (ECF subfamily)